MRRKQKQLERRRQREAELEAKEEAARVAKIEAEAREQQEAAARAKRLIEQRETERLRQKHIQRKEKLVEQKWDKQFDTLLAQIKDRRQKDEKLEEIRIIIQNRESSLQVLDWDSWLSDPLNQRLADLDFDRAMEMFKRDNLLAYRRKPGRSKKRYSLNNYSLSFGGNTGTASRSYVTTDFNPDDYNLNLGFTVSYWVRPDEVGNTMLAFGRKHSNSERFGFGIYRKRQSYFGVGSNDMKTAWVNMDTPVEESLLVQDGSYWNLKTDGTWYHMVVTYDDRADTSSGAARKVYVNGVLRDTDTINWNTTGGSTGGMYFGARNVDDSYNNGWACALDQVAIFDTAKDADWVADVYNTDKRYLDLSRESGLVGYWKFNEGDGTTVKDYSGNENHGTFAAIGSSGGGYPTALPSWEKNK
tara:strand:- start:12909 stop:14153 length:1245 start_codon:yes stop_codon:yes gene_type:complete